MKYQVTVKPGSKKGPLVVADGYSLTVYLRERPVDGAANQALIKVLAEHFGVSKSQVVIKTGARGRQKIVEVNA